ncbi:SRPBCC family protein [Bailinhaonella thermotolerans]|uniref:Cyclase n=1 Tax=Bailinhaonella thermotolerans TaxID=1070861 RepID=A0A3A4B256_9ACTN|nr:SRPBCC family protein [Bailinhaonella thermotolerans]RJL31480.1 cyclase [Bailinhaonella thermotolerans]
MADRTTSRIVIDAPAAEIMSVIADFPAYPEWAGQVRGVRVVEEGPDGRASKVRFALDAGVIKDEYTLGYDWGEDQVSWHVVEGGAVVSELNGSYRLAPSGGATEVTYELAVDIRIPMIGMIKRKAEKVIIDTALKGLKKRVENR